MLADDDDDDDIASGKTFKFDFKSLDMLWF